MQCSRSTSLDVFFQEIQSQQVKVAVLGCGCSVATEPVAEISHQWNISQVGIFFNVTGRIKTWMCMWGTITLSNGVDLYTYKLCTAKREL